MSNFSVTCCIILVDNWKKECHSGSLLSLHADQPSPFIFLLLQIFEDPAISKREVLRLPGLRMGYVDRVSMFQKSCGIFTIPTQAVIG
jgi:hypothetical protein